MKRGVFVTGTDTGVGKTLAACALIHALVDRGIDVMPMKSAAIVTPHIRSRSVNVLSRSAIS